MMRILLLLGLFLQPFVSPAQKKLGTWGIESSFIFSKIIKHNKNFSPTPSGYSYGFELAAVKQTNGNLAGHRKLKYPELGVAFIFLRHEQQQAFGNLYALFGFANFNLLKTRFVDLQFRLGSGLAISPVRHDPISNPENNVIGSVINSFNIFGLRLNIKPHSNLHVHVSGNLTHYSNGNIQRPNLGINSPGLFVGLKYIPELSKMQWNKDPIPKPENPNEVMGRVTIGFQGIYANRGPIYPVYGCALAYSRYTSIINKVSFGWAMEYNYAIREFYEYDNRPSKYSINLQSFNSSIFIGDEILVGRVGILFQTGFYIFNPVDWKKNILYVKLGTNIYLNWWGKNKKHAPFVVSNLKSNYFVAQFVEAGTGYSFRW